LKSIGINTGRIHRATFDCMRPLETLQVETLQVETLQVETLQVETLHGPAKEEAQMTAAQLILHTRRQQIRLFRGVALESGYTLLSLITTVEIKCQRQFPRKH
jgi:hypothetical protein